MTDGVHVTACRIAPTVLIIEVYVEADDGTWDWWPLLFDGDISFVEISTVLTEIRDRNARQR